MENSTTNIKDKLCKYWKYASKDYKLLKIIGSGTFGQVVYSKNRKTNQEVAIKFIQGKFDSNQKVRNIIRELSILRQLSAMKDNFFTTKLHDVIVAKRIHESLSECHGVFLVMDYIPDDLSQMMDDIEP